MDVQWQDLLPPLLEVRGYLGMVAAAVACGGLLGYERQRKGKPVGMLTATLVAVGSTVIARTGLILTETAGLTGDVTRPASMIVSGIGFIGAGAILRSEFNVSGLASAATIWGLGGLGILVGSGHALLALAAALVLFALLRWMPMLEHKVFHGRFCLHTTLVVERDRLDRVASFLWENQLTDFRTEPREADHRVEIRLDECGLEAKAGLVHVLRGLDGVVELEDRRGRP